MIDTSSHPNHWAGSMSVYSQKEGQMFNVGAFLEMIPVCRSLHLASLRYCTCFDEIFLYFRQVALRSSRRTSKVDHGVRGSIGKSSCSFFLFRFVQPRKSIQVGSLQYAGVGSAFGKVLTLLSFWTKIPSGLLTSAVGQQLHKCRVFRVFSAFFPMCGKVGQCETEWRRAIEDGILNH